MWKKKIKAINITNGSEMNAKYEVGVPIDQEGKMVCSKIEVSRFGLKARVSISNGEVAVFKGLPFSYQEK